MPLPRFNDGKVGALEWHHLNEAFDLIEATNPALGGTRPIASGPLVLAQLGAAVDGAYQWSEVVLRDDGEYEVVVGGRNSTLDGDTRAAAAFSLDGAQLAVGTVVFITPRRTKTGKSWWGIVSTAGGGSQKAMQITGVAASNLSYLWGYKAREVTVGFAVGQGGNIVTATQFGPEYSIWNLAELRADSGGLIGVGTVPPAGVSSVRRPISAGVVVVASKVPTASLWVFSMPNGYAFSCTSGGG
jgi:hypothetical protein